MPRTRTSYCGSMYLSYWPLVVGVLFSPMMKRDGSNNATSGQAPPMRKEFLPQSCRDHRRLSDPLPFGAQGFEGEPIVRCLDRGNPPATSIEDGAPVGQVLLAGPNEIAFLGQDHLMSPMTGDVA